MNEWKVIIPPAAISEIRKIYGYIAHTLLVPGTALNQVQRIFKAAKSLANMPKKFALYEKEPWRGRGLRKRPVDNYVILYLTNDNMKEVVIFHVFYGGRDIENILRNEAERGGAEGLF